MSNLQPHSLLVPQAVSDAHKRALGDLAFWMVRLDVPGDVILERIRQAVDEAVASVITPPTPPYASQINRSLSQLGQNGLGQLYGSLGQQSGLSTQSQIQAAVAAHEAQAAHERAVERARQQADEQARAQKVMDEVRTEVADFDSIKEAVNAHAAQVQARLEQERQARLELGQRIMDDSVGFDAAQEQERQDRVGAELAQATMDAAMEEAAPAAPEPAKGAFFPVQPKPVRTPDGPFSSVREACKHYDRSTAWGYAKIKAGEWSYGEAEPEPQPEPEPPRMGRKARKVRTPDGVFASVKEATKHHGIGHSTGHLRLKQGAWSYVDEPKAPKVSVFDLLAQAPAPKAPQGVRTPEGTFPSVEAAAQHYGYTTSRVAYVVEHGTQGWDWVHVDGETTPACRTQGVVTPRGLFPSIQEASKAIGMQPDEIRARIDQQIDGWHYYSEAANRLIQQAAA